VQRRKLLHRTRRQKGNLSLKDLENIEKRAGSALVEMREAWKFDHVIALHDGEGNDNWDAFYYPIGSARAALTAFVALLQDETPAGVERWEAGLVP
jgi:guanylate kinase